LALPVRAFTYMYILADTQPTVSNHEEVLFIAT